jgi:hypothetical protein
MLHIVRTVRVFTGEEIAARLKIILTTMDRAAKRADGGHYEMHALYRAAAIELHDMIVEVSE